MNTISEEYKELNEELHIGNPYYGASSLEWLDHIQKIILRTRVKTILDYGCGKGLLKHGLNGLNLDVQNYDPCVPEFCLDSCRCAELVVCTDVMEHVENDYIEPVLKDLQYLTEKYIFFVISTVPGRKLLPDGSNTHRSVHPADWWILKVSWLFDVVETAVLTRKEEDNISACVTILAKALFSEKR